MPYELGTIWNVTSKYIYNTLDKNIGIGTTTPICELDVYCNIAENGIKLEDKYQLKPEHNKKYDLVVREDLDEDNSELIIWYKFNKDDFTSNFTNNLFPPNEEEHYGNLITIGTRSNLQKEYYVGTGSAEINVELYYKIKMSANQFIAEKCTFCFWLFLNEECENDRYILNLQDYDDSAIFYFKYTTDKLIIYKNQDDYIEYYRSLDKNKWHHITIIINDTASALQKQRTLLIDGIPINSNPTGTTISTVLRGGSTGTADIYLGYTTASINGYIDDFRIYQTNLDIEYIQNKIIGKITKITPGNISANGNYGIDIVNYSSNVNIGTENSNVDLRVFGNLKVDGDLSISKLDIVTAEFITLNVTSNLTVGNDVNIENDLTVSKTIIENQRTLAQKYASISQIDKNTDVIISKMTDKEDVRSLYSNMPQFFQSNLILAYDFDFNIDDIDNSNDFFSNNVLQLNSNTDPIYSTFSGYNIVPNRSKNAIDYYGTKYVKGNSSLHCGSNILNSGGIDYYSFNTQGTINNASFSSSESYTIAFWIRFNEINKNQYIFNFGVPINPLDTKKSINISLNSSNNLNIEIINGILSYNNNIDELEFKKDEWYHIVLILKNDKAIDTIPTNIYTNSNLLKQYFAELEYTDNTIPGSDRFTFNTTANMATIFTYVNGIYVKKLSYSQNITIFGNERNCSNYFGVLNSSTTTDYLNGYIDDFKMYQTVVPINYINEYIIGDALIIKPGLLSAIGNYGINIINFTNIVSVGNCNNDVDLHIYGLLKIEDTKLTISNCDIDVIRDTLTTSNFAILETLDVSNINVSNIEIYDLISGPDFHLGSSNFINNIEIDHLSNINLNSSNITANTITVNNELNLKNATLSNINVVGINIDNTFSISDNDIKIRSHLIIGDNSSKDRRYDFESLLLLPSRKVSIKNVADPNYYLYSNFNLYNDHYEQFPIITPTDDIQIFDKSIIFYGNTNEDDYDIHFKNNYIRNENCNIKDEINKSYAEGEGEDRNRTRIKLDVGNIKLQNGFIELKHKDILEDDEPSTLKIEENQISITSNVNITILNDSLMLSNNDNHCNCLLTNSNFMFNNGNGFTDAETLKIKTINITEKIDIKEINTTNSDSNTISINTSNEHNPYGKIQGFLCSNSKIDIQNDIITNNNIKCEELNTSNINVSNIICEYNIGFTPDFTSNTKITRESIEVQTLQIYGSIILGDQGSSGNDNSINGGFGSLSIKTINTTNPYSNALSIDTFYGSNLGKIQGFLYSNSKIDINNEIRTNSNIYCVDLESSNITTTGNIDASNIEVSNITVNTITVNAELNVSNIIASNIDCSDTIDSSNIISSNITVNNTLFASNIQGINEGLCSIEGILENNSIIYINCNITTAQGIFSEYQYTSNTLYVSNIESINQNLCSIVGSLNGDSIIDISGDITTTGNIDASNIEVSNITVNTITVNAELNVSNIIASNIDCSDTIDSSNIISSNITVNNTLFASNIQGINEGLCSIEGILENNSIIYINCNITTKQGIFSEYQYTSNTLCTSNIRGLNEYLCSIVGKLESNSKIDISNDIRTSGSLYTSNTLYVSNIESINQNRCSIVGSLNGDSIIDISGDITTLTNIRGNHLYIDNIYSKNFGNEIIFNNDTVNTNVTRCIELKVEQISSFDSIDKIKIYNDIIIENEQYGEKEPFVILTSSNIIIKDKDQNTEFKFETNKISYNGNDKNTNIIEIDSSSDVTINCDILNVTQIDFESDQFEFDKIITYTRNANSDPDKQWPNVYIGFNTEFEKRQADRVDNNYLDVLYVDTPDNSRLKTGNILIQKELTIDDEHDSTVNFKIITKNSYTYFKNHNNFDLLVFSLKNKSIGINTKPPDIDNIKLFVKDGGIQTTGDIIAFANISDKRFKMNITPFNTNDGIDIINKLNPVKFRWKADLFNTTMANKDDIGFIAQEVAEIIPEAVAKCKIEMNDIDYNYINYERIIPYLVNNIKYLNNKIVELEDKLNGI